MSFLRLEQFTECNMVFSALKSRTGTLEVCFESSLALVDQTDLTGKDRFCIETSLALVLRGSIRNMLLDPQKLRWRQLKGRN